MVVVFGFMFGQRNAGRCTQGSVLFIYIIYFRTIDSFLAGCLGICGRFPTPLGRYFPDILQDRPIKLANLEILMP